MVATCSKLSSIKIMHMYLAYSNKLYHTQSSNDYCKKNLLTKLVIAICGYVDSNGAQYLYHMPSLGHYTHCGIEK